ncbi:dynamin family protein [Cellulomonas wangsupingiae]|uniref:Dynamin family protein n=1 Tax=Cellulomonas wangsupingiae TaxID=2968085 RepID=A0ABY5K7I9_9CELL|nr:dynamin family protein [Cellulomonas wangsupingiae]MCC2334617.1 dynamin family protein [Cellulomonas wangsupingiae]UUI66417.1 dynamin family protein [Cellulomonas wangsupingiae]
MSLTLDERVAALSAALDAGEGRLPAPLVARTRALVARVQERAGLSAEHTVVALAGATGSGKSSLFNALVGADLAATGTRRPTTSHPLAVVVGDTPDATGPAQLLDWLEVGRRHALPAGPVARAAGGSDEDAATPAVRRARRGRGDGLPAGLVLLDLPDHDSVVVEHRVRAERLVARADLLVWVVDPQKYADAALHERYLRPLAGHDDVVVLVLNQADRLTERDVAAVLGDLRGLAAADGLDRARVVAASARTGAGVDELRSLVAEAVERREATTRRFGADLRAAAQEVLDACGAAPRGRGRRAGTDDLLDALEDAAGVPTVVTAVRRSAVRRAAARTGWPPVRWLARFRPDPLRRLHLAPRPAAQAEVTRTSLPPAGPAQRARAATAVRDHADAALVGAPDAWALAARARLDISGLPDALDHAVARTPLLPERAVWWWRAVGALQWLLLAAAVAGALWLGGIALLAYLQLPDPVTPVWGPAPAPTVLLVGGVLAGLLVAALGALAGRVGARRRARAARRRLRSAVAEVARRLVLAPLAEESAALEACRTQAARAAGR